MNNIILIKLRQNNKSLSHINKCLNSKISNSDVINHENYQTNNDIHITNKLVDNNDKHIDNNDKHIDNNDKHINNNKLVDNNDNQINDKQIEIKCDKVVDNASEHKTYKTYNLTNRIIIKKTNNNLKNNDNIIKPEKNTNNIQINNKTYNLTNQNFIKKPNEITDKINKIIEVTNNTKINDECKTYKTYNLTNRIFIKKPSEEIKKNTNNVIKPITKNNINLNDKNIQTKTYNLSNKYLPKSKQNNNYINDTDNIIIPYLTCGLGNQMFILSAGYCASKYHNSELHIYNFYENEHNIFNNDYKKNIFKYFGNHINENQKKIDNKYKTTQNKCFNAYNLNEYNPPVIYKGYFQYYPTLKEYESEIRELFCRGLDDYYNKIYEKYDKENLNNSAFLHVRRGDYLKDPKRRPICSTQYYSICIINIINIVENIYVFSDDYNYLVREPLFKLNKKIIIIDSKDELYALAFMTLCKKAAICANSTFSWWGAYLGAYKERNNVYVPKEWIKTIEYDINTLVPEEWIKI